jgi:hypothetical protein
VATGHGTRQVEQEVQAGLVAPVHVLDDEQQQRRAGGASSQEVGEFLEPSPFRPVRIAGQLGRGLARSTLEIGQ